MGIITELKNVSKIYYKDRKRIDALKKINLTINKGDFITIFGPSGAGKSTLLHLIGALDEPTEGEIIFENNSLNSMDDDTIAKLRNTRIGFIFQFHHLLPEFTALENVMMPGLIGEYREDEVRKRAIEILEEVGLKDRLNHFPGELSGGEEQRVAVARSLINNPSVLLADEPTGDVDSENGERILEILTRFNTLKEVTLVIVTHDRGIADRGRRKVLLEDGNII
jgi:lipoprotein-releasing system ATP-binding protein